VLLDGLAPQPPKIHLTKATELYGSVSYAVGRRTRELGIRGALGASRRRIVWTALRDVAVLACGATSVLLAFLAIRPFVDLFPAGIDPWTPGPVLGVILVLLASNLDSCPARS
jgi:putative ABC transport system permease protein